jgi:hypothetical protein
VRKKERWLPVVGYENRYEVSDQGRVRSLDRVYTVRGGGRRYQRRYRGRILKLRIAFRGYLHIGLRNGRKQKFFAVHRLVLTAFVGPCPSGMECRHFPDRDPSNNNLRNLSWDTRICNAADREIHGTRPRGETNGRAKLTSRKVLEIRCSRLSQRALARKYGVAQPVIGRIKLRRTWRHVS